VQLRRVKDVMTMIWLLPFVQNLLLTYVTVRSTSYRSGGCRSSDYFKVDDSQSVIKSTEECVSIGRGGGGSRET
jgi:hypothetical protein